MLDQDKILNFLKMTGPTLPAKVAKNIGTNILLASAHLSDLSAQGKIKISKLKIGGSPLYYLPGQESQLIDFAPGNVNQKDLLVLEKLKSKKVLREGDLELVEKVGLRNLRDFAIPLNVSTPNKTELFWKWFMMSNDEANSMIKEILTGVKETVTAPREEVPKVEESKAEEKEVIEPSEEVTEIISEDKKEQQKTLTEQKEKVVEVKEKPSEELKEEVEENIDQEPVKEENVPVEEKEESKPEKKPSIAQKIKEKVKRKKKATEDDFSPIVKQFFDSLRIMVESKEIIRKNSETDYHVKVPSAVGHITYFCKAKSKNKCDEKDISAAYMEAQTKKLPLLFLYTNEITKKAEEMLESGVFENAIIKKIENETE